MNLPLISKDEREDWIKVLEAMYENHIIVDPEVSSGMLSAREANQFVTPAVSFYREVEPKFDKDIMPIVEKSPQISHAMCVVCG